MKIIKNILVTLMLVVLTVGVQAQTRAEKKAEKKAERVLKKEARTLALQENRTRIIELVNNQTFVIEANTLFDRYQNRYEVSPIINFVKIDGDRAVVQFGFNHLIGFNGVGGLTIDGVISGYQAMYKKDKNPVTITANISSPNLLGPATLTLSILDDGTARATIIGSFGSRLTFAGNVYDLEESSVYEGNTIL